ncbi:MAG: glucosyl-3-phosphoglycerate synthase [Candidatus Nanopelagicales bacterium]
MRPEVRSWFDRRTSSASHWPLDRLLTAKGDATVDVILPALNEEATVGEIVASVRGALMTSACPLVDDLVVVDTHSADATAERAAAAGARVVSSADILPGVALERGKGEAMWRGLAATSGDLVVFVDADLRSFTPHYITGLLGPLLLDDGVHLVKAVYDRPLVSGDVRIAAGGGRVTEILARPLINALWPDLSAVAQPLSGEYAARRTLLEALPMPCGYGIEIGLLVDTYRSVGLDGIAQVDLGEREHRHQDATLLARMSAQILHAALIRADRGGAVYAPAAISALPVFSHDDGTFDVQEKPIQTVERPPLLTVPEYRESRSAPRAVHR